MNTLRRIASWIHLYGGLSLGVLLIVISVSGSVLVFEDTLHEWLQPDLYHVEPAGERLSMDRVLEAVAQAHPEATPWIATLPTTPTDPVVVRLGPEAPSVYIDPYRGTVLGDQRPDEGLVHIVAGLHTDLLAGRTGAIIVGVSGLLLVLLTATGLVLWWPRRLKRLWQALRITWAHGSLRFNYDLHRAGGFYTALFLVITSLTGSAFIFYPTTQQLIATVTATEPWPSSPPTVEADSGSISDEAVSYSAALQAAGRALPNATPTFLTMPEDAQSPVTVRLRTPPEWHPNGRSFVYVHPETARVLRVDDAREAPWGAQVLQTFYPLHIGAVGGLVVKWLYVILGLAPAVLSVTGTIIWYKRWRRSSPSSSTNGVPAATASNTRYVIAPEGGGGEETPEIPSRP